MQTSSEFRARIVEPAIAEFRGSPDSLLRACTAVWAVDAYASHVAWEQAENASLSENDRRRVEGRFKKAVEQSSHDYGWDFRLLRELSNTTKHAVRVLPEKAVVATGKAVKNEEWDNYSAYFTNSEHTGKQVVVELEVTLAQEPERWVDVEGREYPGLIFPQAPVLNLVVNSLRLVDDYGD